MCRRPQGTGSVLGASDAKSDSIAKALDAIQKNTNRDLEYASEMARSLRSIETISAGSPPWIARQMGVSGGAFDQSGSGLGKTTASTQGGAGRPALSLGGGIGLAISAASLIATKIPIIGGAIDTMLKALFGTKKTVSLLDQGFEFAWRRASARSSRAACVGDIYNALQTTKKSKFFGISTGTKTSSFDPDQRARRRLHQQINRC
jgi:hypothetical protein